MDIRQAIDQLEKIADKHGYDIPLKKERHEEGFWGLEYQDIEFYFDDMEDAILIEPAD